VKLTVDLDLVPKSRERGNSHGWHGNCISIELLIIYLFNNAASTANVV